MFDKFINWFEDKISKQYPIDYRLVGLRPTLLLLVQNCNISQEILDKAVNAYIDGEDWEIREAMHSVIDNLEV